MSATEPADRVSVRDLLSVPGLGLRLVAAPGEVDRLVRWAHPTELLDPRPYLRGGELVLTVGSSLIGEEQCRTFVQNLLEAGVTAVGYGLGDVSEEVPPALLALCRDHGLPLLAVPREVPFQRITELLADRRAEARNARSRRLQVLTARVLGAVTEGRSMTELLALLAAELGGTLEYGDGVLRWAPLTDADVRPSAEVLRHLAMALAVRQHEEDLDQANRRRELGRLVELVLQGRADVEVLRAPLESAGVDTSGTVVPAVWPGGAGALVQPLLGACLLADVGDTTLTITAGAAPVEAASRELALPCGRGEAVPVEQLDRAVSAAAAALRLARARGELVDARGLATFRSLLEFQSPERLEPFAEKLVLPLVRHDQAQGSALLATLRCFLEQDGSVSATAQELFLHPNSLRHRLKRIEELTGANPRSFDDRVALAVGLWAWDRGLRRRH